MTRNTPEPDREDDLRVVLAQLAERLERVEARLGMDAAVQIHIGGPASPAPAAAPVKKPAGEQESLEFELGQNWFALIGIVVLAIGMAFMLSLPYEGMSQYIPSLGGYLLGAAVLGLARLARQSFEAIAKYLRGAAMLLLFYSTLRLFYFTADPVFATSSAAGRLIFLMILGLNLWLAWRRDSVHLFMLALVTGYATAVAIGGMWFLLMLVTGLALLALFVQLKKGWRTLIPAAVVLSMAAYVIWAIGNPLIGGEMAIRADSPVPVYFILLWVLVFSLASLLRSDLGKEDTPVQVTGLFVCLFAFGVFALHNLLAFDATFLISHLVASVLFLGLALTFWHREESLFSTFLYAMTGYMALSLALVKAFEVPEVFVALSLQSLVVIATALYFRSRFIIVANVLIFIGILIGYMVVAQAEQGMSIGFGVVALVSARVLNFAKDRLSLKTELMRNTYLAIAFLSFPYALYYLVPQTYVAVAWVALALFYYAMNALIRNRKYRWMGHMTLLLTVLYVGIVGTRNLEGGYRIISFLVLGTIMLIVSLAFTLSRSRRGRGKDRAS